MRKTIAAMLFAGVCAAAPAQAVQLIGVIDCGKWLADKNPEYKWWLAGYMSGMTIKDNQGTDPLAGVTAEQLVAWMDKYCRENPLSYVTAGGVTLLKELKARH
jgi:hypothetical protein